MQMNARHFLETNIQHRRSRLWKPRMRRGIQRAHRVIYKKFCLCYFMTSLRNRLVKKQTLEEKLGRKTCVPFTSAF